MSAPSVDCGSACLSASVSPRIEVSGRRTSAATASCSALRSSSTITVTCGRASASCRARLEIAGSAPPSGRVRSTAICRRCSARRARSSASAWPSRAVWSISRSSAFFEAPWESCSSAVCERSSISRSARPRRSRDRTLGLAEPRSSRGLQLDARLSRTRSSRGLAIGASASLDALLGGLRTELGLADALLGLAWAVPGRLEHLEELGGPRGRQGELLVGGLPAKLGLAGASSALASRSAACRSSSAAWDTCCPAAAISLATPWASVCASMVSTDSGIAITTPFEWLVE